MVSPMSNKFTWIRGRARARVPARIVLSILSLEIAAVQVIASVVFKNRYFPEDFFILCTAIYLSLAVLAVYLENVIEKCDRKVRVFSKISLIAALLLLHFSMLVSTI